MSFTTQCGYCSQPYVLDDHYAGQSVTCAKCGQVFAAQSVGGIAIPPAYGQLAPGSPAFGYRPSRLPVIVASIVGVVLVVMLGIVATLLVSRGLRDRTGGSSVAQQLGPAEESPSEQTVAGNAPPAATVVDTPPPTAAAGNAPAGNPPAGGQFPTPPAPPRDRAIVFPELLSAMNEQLGIARGIVNEAGAKAVAARWAQAGRRAGQLEREFNSTPPNVSSIQQAQAFQQQLQQLNAVRQQIVQERGRLGSLPGVMPALSMAEAELAGSDFQEFARQQGADKTITVVVHQLPADEHQRVQQRLLAIMGNGFVSGSRSGRTATFTLTPVDDLEAFAAEIDFGRVAIDRDRRTIVVHADEAKLPRPEATNP
jgi:hypothetical protein